MNAETPISPRVAIQEHNTQKHQSGGRETKRWTERLSNSNGLELEFRKERKEKKEKNISLSGHILMGLESGHCDLYSVVTYEPFDLLGKKY